MIMLRKYSDEELAEYETARQKRKLRRLFALTSYPGAQPAMMVAESRSSTYNIDSELDRQLAKYSQT